MSPPDTCDFCKARGEDEITGEMQRTPDRTIVAHYNCMLYSPQVFQIDSEEDEEGFEFNIESVQSEIERGQKLRCNICRKAGATAGCDVSSCPKTYHYPCVQKAYGSSSPNRCVVYCKDHKSKNTANGSKDTDEKTKKYTSRSSANQTAIWEDCSEVGDGCKRRTITRTSGKYIGHKDVYYLSPKGEKFRSKKELQRHMDESTYPSSSKSKDRRTQSPAKKGEGIQTRRRMPPPRTTLKDSRQSKTFIRQGEGIQTRRGMPPPRTALKDSRQSKTLIRQGEGIQTSRRMPPPRTTLKESRQSKTLIHQNNGTRAANAVSGRTDVNVTDKATGSHKSEREKTPGTQSNMNVLVSLQRLPAEEHYTSEQPASHQGAPSTELNAVAQTSSRQFGGCRRCSLTSGKATSKTRHLTCRNCSEPLPDKYEDILCRECLPEESVKNAKTQQNSCRDQYSINTGSIRKLTDQGKSHDVPPKKRPYILQDQDLPDLPVSIESLDDSEGEREGDGGNSDASQIDHPTGDTSSASSTCSPQATHDQTSEPATSSMVPISAQAGTCNGHDVADASGPNNDSQVLQNVNRRAHVDQEESFLQSLAPYLHKIPIKRRLKAKGAIIVMLQAAMSPKKSQGLFQAINLWQLKNEGPADVEAP